jgi:hypothetical protein
VMCDVLMKGIAVRARWVAIAGVVLGLWATVAHASILSQLDITTRYGSIYTGAATDAFLGGGAASPDTGFLTFTNSGNTTFVGDLGFTAVAGAGGDLSFVATMVTLAPGESGYFAIGSNSRSDGGFNSPWNGAAQLGVAATAFGFFDSSYFLNLTVYDYAIHSGVPQTSPASFRATDAYVLQGGDPAGFDNGAAYASALAPGHFTWSEVDPSPDGVPEPASWALMLGGLGVAGAALRHRRNALAA